MAAVIRVRKTRRRNRKGKPWVLRWRAPNGREAQMTIGPMSERHAEKQRQVLQGHLNGILEPDDAPVSFEEFREAYLAKVKAELAEQSWKLAKWSLERFERYAEPRLLADVTRKTAETYKTRRLGEVAGTTVAKDLRTLHAAFAWAVEQGHLPENPFEGVRVARTVAKSKPVLSPRECESLLDVASRRGTVFHAFVSLALETGMRISELANVQAADLDLSDGLIRVSAKEGWSPKGKRERVVAVSEDTAGLLFELRERSPYTLAGTSREEWKRAMRRELTSACREAGVPVVTPHDLRRTAATLMAMSGVPMDVAQQVLGHRSYQTTQEYYVRIGQHEAARKALETVRKRARSCDLSVTTARKVG